MSINKSKKHIISSSYQVLSVSTNTENYVILDGKRYDFPIGANISVINDKIYVNGRKYKDKYEKTMLEKFLALFKSVIRNKEKPNEIIR